MAHGSEKLRLRTFKVPADIENRLSTRAQSTGRNKADLAREYLDALLDKNRSSTAAPDTDTTNAPLVLRAYYLTPEQDEKLDAWVERASRRGIRVSKGQLFRAALIAGLGIAHPRSTRSAARSVATRRRAPVHASPPPPMSPANLRQVVALALSIVEMLTKARRGTSSAEALRASTRASAVDVRAALDVLENAGAVTVDRNEVRLSTGT